MSYMCSPVCLVAQDKSGRHYLIRHSYTWDKKANKLTTNYYISNDPKEPDDTILKVSIVDAPYVMDEIIKRKLGFYITDMIPFNPKSKQLGKLC